LQGYRLQQSGSVNPETCDLMPVALVLRKVTFCKAVLDSPELAEQIDEGQTLYDRPPVGADLDVPCVMEELPSNPSTGTPAISISKSPLLANQTLSLSIL
jgi:hypothetical protein